MTTEEKLKQFYKICMEDAEQQYQSQVTAYEKCLLAEYEACREEQKRRQEHLLSAEKEKILQKERRRLFEEHKRLRHLISDQKSDYREKLFAEVWEVISAFRKTPEYRSLLEQQIKKIRERAGKDVCEIYLEEADSGLFPEQAADIRFCREKLGGGTVGVIPAQNILIDQSFRTRFEEEKQAFCFPAGEFRMKSEQAAFAAGGVCPAESWKAAENNWRLTQRKSS